MCDVVAGEGEGFYINARVSGPAAVLEAKIGNLYSAFSSHPRSLTGFSFDVTMRDELEDD